MPKISVIIPVYNTAPYLRQCMDSVAAQTLRDIEIICVNDGSTDGSPDILEGYAERDTRITIISQEHGGAGNARNKGLKIAKGDYLSFLDSDDFFDPAMLEKMYEKSKALQTDVTICRSKSYDNETGNSRENNFELKGTSEKEIFSYKDIEKFFEFSVPWTWNKLFNREFVRKLNLQFQEICFHNDHFFVFSALYNAKRITIVNVALANWRINRQNSLTTSHDKDPLCAYKALNAVKNSLEKSGVFLESEYAFRFNVFIIITLNYNLCLFKTVNGFKQLYTTLYDYIVCENKIDKTPKEYFYDDFQYDEMKRIVSLPWDEYLLHTKNRLQKERDSLQGARDWLQGEHDQLHGECERLQREDDQLKAENGYLRGECNQLQAERDNLLASRTWRIGRAVTYLPRKARGFFRCLKQNGMWWTMKLLGKKVIRRRQ
jgi:glycosyltransferase involved in cell wall biosynthesis